jgi:hypothetical protein
MIGRRFKFERARWLLKREPSRGQLPVEPVGGKDVGSVCGGGRLSGVSRPKGEERNIRRKIMWLERAPPLKRREPLGHCILLDEQKFHKQRLGARAPTEEDC